MDWAVADSAPAGSVGENEGLRARKKRLMRQLLTDTATGMFLEHGFDAVRVIDVAAACGVSEKTVFNYFPTKEALILDRWQVTMSSVPSQLTQPDRSPVQAAVQILAQELAGLMSWLAAQEDQEAASILVRRFGVLTRSTPALRAYHRDLMDHFAAAAAEVLAAHSGMKPEDPEPQIAATALLGLWDIQWRSIRAHLDGTRSPTQVRKAVAADVARAAALIDSGLQSLGTPKPRSSAPRNRVLSVAATAQAGSSTSRPSSRRRTGPPNPASPTR